MDKLVISLNEIEQLSPDQYVYIDMRGRIAYAHGHIPDAICLDEDPELQQLPKDKILIIYCSVGDNSIEAARRFREKGYEAFSLKRGFREWLLRQYRELSTEELQKYDRQIILPQIGTEGQKKLKDAKVLIVGAGGLGSPAALYLAGAGIGTIGIMDADEVSLSNLHRQIIHTESRVGVNKAESAKEALASLNSLIKVHSYPVNLTPDNAEALIGEYDFVIDAADRFETKFLINDTCVLLSKPFCHGGVVQFSGQVMTYVPGGEYPCFRCIMGEIPRRKTVRSCNQDGVLGAAVGVIGCMQALEAIKYLTGTGDLLTGKMAFFDGLSMEMETVPLEQKNADCRVCGEQKNIFRIRDNAAEYLGGQCSV